MQVCGRIYLQMLNCFVIIETYLFVSQLLRCHPCILGFELIHVQPSVSHHCYCGWPSTDRCQDPCRRSDNDDCRLSQIQMQIQIQKRFIETHIHIQQRYIRSLYNSKHSLETAPACTHRDNSATFTSKRRCDVVPKQNDAAIPPRVRREWHVIHKDISNSTWITCVSMRVIRSPEAYTALNYDVWSNTDSNVCRASVVPTSVQLTSLSEDRILYWLCDVALVFKAATSASKTRIQLGTEWMIIKPFKYGIIPASPSSHTSFLWVIFDCTAIHKIMFL